MLRATDEEAIRDRMGYRYPPGAVRRLDDALLSAFGDRYVGLHGNAHRRELLDRPARAAPRGHLRHLDKLSHLSHHGDMAVQTSRPAYRARRGPAWASPWAMYAALRDHDPVHHVVPAGRQHEDYYVLTRHEDVFRAAVDTATFSSAQGLTVEYDELEKIGLADNPPMVMLDPPEHTAFRKLVSRGFTPRAVREVEPAVRAYVVERLERLRAEGGGDIVAELFKPLPSMVVAHYLGVPAEDRDRFDAWTDAIVAAELGRRAVRRRLTRRSASDGLLLRADRAAPRRAHPADDTVSHLVAAGVGDDDARAARDPRPTSSPW